MHAAFTRVVAIHSSGLSSEYYYGSADIDTNIPWAEWNVHGFTAALLILATMLAFALARRERVTLSSVVRVFV
jgi:hypothetical protein